MESKSSETLKDSSPVVRKAANKMGNACKKEREEALKCSTYTTTSQKEEKCQRKSFDTEQFLCMFFTHLTLYFVNRPFRCLH